MDDDDVGAGHFGDGEGPGCKAAECLNRVANCFRGLAQTQFAAGGVVRIGCSAEAHGECECEDRHVADGCDLRSDSARVQPADGISVEGEFTEVIQIVAVGIGADRFVARIGEAKLIDP